MRVATAAFDLGADFGLAPVFVKRGRLLVDRVEEARPAGAGIELGLRVKERLTAADAVIDPLLLSDFPVGPAEGALGPLLAGDAKLLAGQDSHPLGVGLDDFFRFVVFLLVRGCRFRFRRIRFRIAGLSLAVRRGNTGFLLRGGRLWRGRLPLSE